MLRINAVALFLFIKALKCLSQEFSKSANSFSRTEQRVRQAHFRRIGNHKRLLAPTEAFNERLPHTIPVRVQAPEGPTDAVDERWPAPAPRSRHGRLSGAC